MNLSQLRDYLNRLASELQNGDRKLLEARLESLTSAFPFSEYEYMLMFLRDCNGFVFIGVWVDQIVYWVMTSKEAKKNKYFSHQHSGGIEYQIGITDKNIAEFERYKVSVSKLADTILQRLKKK